VAILVGLALVAGLAIVARRDWLEHGIPPDPTWWWSAFGVAMYAAVTTGFVVRRIGRPQLRRPLLLFVLVIPLLVVELISAIRDAVSDDITTRDVGTKDESPFTSPMGRGLAIVWTIFLLALYALCITVILRRDHP
jgi:hypothetical protein